MQEGSNVKMMRVGEEPSRGQELTHPGLFFLYVAQKWSHFHKRLHPHTLSNLKYFEIHFSSIYSEYTIRVCGFLLTTS